MYFSFVKFMLRLLIAPNKLPTVQIDSVVLCVHVIDWKSSEAEPPIDQVPLSHDPSSVQKEVGEGV